MSNNTNFQQTAKTLSQLLTIKIKSTLPQAVADITSHPSYAFLKDVLPVYCDDDMPKVAKKCLYECGSPACCVNDEYIAFSSELMATVLIKAYLEAFADIQDEAERWAVIEMRVKSCDERTLKTEILAVLSHEFTHAICEHAKLARLHGQKYKDVDTFFIAADIQANRGFLVSPRTMIYQMGVTDEQFPEAKGCYTLATIYAAIKKAHKNDIDQYADSVRKSMPKSGEASTTEQQQQKPNEAPSSASSLSAEQKASIRRTMNRHAANQQTENGTSLMDKLAERYDLSTAEMADTADSYGTRGGDAKGELSQYDVLANLSADEIVNTAKARVIKRVIEKNLAKLRGVIKGELSKQKVKTYARPSRRQYQHTGLMRKGFKKATRSIPKILVALDKSSSMNAAKVSEVAMVINTIVDQLGRSTKGCYISMHDNDVYPAVPLRNTDELLSRYCACGGNDFSKVYMQAIELGVDVVLNVGDGLDSFSDRGTQRLERIKTAQAKSQSPLIWYDVIIPHIEHTNDGQWYENTVSQDYEALGIVRKTISLAGDYAARD